MGWFVLAGFCLSACCFVPAAKRHGRETRQGRRFCRAPRVWKFPLFFTTLFPAHLLFIVFFPVCRVWAWLLVACGAVCGAVCLSWKGSAAWVVVLGAVDFVVSIAFGV